MRRSTLIAVLAGALFGLAAAAGISLAGSGSSSSNESNERRTAAPTQGTSHATYAKRGHRRHGGRGHGGHRLFGPAAIAFNGFADRLNVSRKELHAALRGVKNRALDRAVDENVITSAERDALKSCMKSRRRDNCNRSQARAAHRKLHRAMRQRVRSDAAAVKAQVIEDLADELDKQPADVEAAARAELVELLDTAVTLGFVTEKGRQLALECWDTPNECDRAALRAEVKHRLGHGHRRGGRRGHP